ncbi:hypothetical protein BGW38_006725 [Lunasporangiospora selenospora]|uniref:Uncharacterized protein n=1 Tax=Lunasporangiospora selenospora TaxID=979761 RepID=A0A9P6FND1_9FUNG|nr:hypothetical protein BGW38_006725 [Lunasporangiospora selenospora]
MVRKRSYRSLRHHILQAFNAVDNHTTYGNSDSKRWRQTIDKAINEIRQEGHEGEDEEEDENKDENEDEEEDENKDENEDEEEDENQDENEDEDSNSSVSNESASQSSGSEYFPGGAKSQSSATLYSVHYLTGAGSIDCSRNLWTPWIIEGEDLAGKIWTYRETICSKARNFKPLSGSVEKLALSHVYLFDPKDTSSGLYDIIGATHWASITSLSLKTLIPEDAFAQLGSFAIALSQMRYSNAQNSVLDWQGNRDIKKVLSCLLSDDFLWKGADFNELEMVKHG